MIIFNATAAFAGAFLVSVLLTRRLKAAGDNGAGQTAVLVGGALLGLAIVAVAVDRSGGRYLVGVAAIVIGGIAGRIVAT